MIELRKTLTTIHRLLDEQKIPHALIGAMALTCYGSMRATADIDFLIHENDKQTVAELLKTNGFKLDYESEEVLQFSGIGYVDFLIARRPLSQKMILDSRSGGPQNVNFVQPEDLIALKIQAYKNDSQRTLQDKADIQFIIDNVTDLNWEKIKSYADLFNEWESIREIKEKA